MKQVGVLRKQDNFVGVLRKQIEGAEIVQTSGGTPTLQLRTPVFQGGEGNKKMPLRADPKRGITSRKFGEMRDAQIASQQAKEKLQDIRSKRVPLTEQSAIDPVKFSQAQAAQRMEQMDTPLYESAIEAAEPRTYEEKYGLEAAQRAPAAQQEAAYGRGGVGGVPGRGLGTALAGAYGGLQALLALNRASASGQDFASGLGGAALQGMTSYGTVAPTAQNIGGEVGSRVAVRGGQMMDDRAEKRAKGPGRSDAQTAEPTVAVQRTPRPRLTQFEIERQRRLAEVRRQAEEERRIQDADAAARARGNVPVLGPTAPPPAAPAPAAPVSGDPNKITNWGQGTENLTEEQKLLIQNQTEGIHNAMQNSPYAGQSGNYSHQNGKITPLDTLTEQATGNQNAAGGSSYTVTRHQGA